MGQACVDAHLKWYRDTDQDFIKIMCDGYFGYPNETLEKMENVSQLYDMKPLGSGHKFIRVSARATTPRRVVLLLFMG